MSELNESAQIKYKADKDGGYTYEDYASWDDDKRRELIQGVPYAMTSPTIAHQGIIRELLLQIGGFLRGKPCVVFPAPFDVRLHANATDDTVVQPDLTVVCDRSKLSDGKNCKGAPDFIIEILSPSTARHDRLLKLNLYQDAGVQEYWIVDPDTRLTETYVLEDGKYSFTRYSDDADIASYVINGLMVDMRLVFADILEST